MSWWYPGQVWSEALKAGALAYQDVQRFTLRTEHAACLVEALVATVTHTIAASECAGQ